MPILKSENIKLQDFTIKPSGLLTSVLKASDKYSISGLIVWIAVLFFFPIIGQALILSAFVSGAMFMAGAWAIGILILSGVESINVIKGIVKDGIAVLLGSVAMFGFLYLIPGAFSSLILYPIIIILLLGVFILKRVEWVCYDPGSLLAIVAVILYYGVFRNSTDLGQSLINVSTHFDGVEWDATYFTAVVASMRIGTLQAVYEVGSPLNYQIGSFFAPSAFSAATNISSHASLWGCWMPFYKILGLLSISEFVLLLAPVRYSLWPKSLIVLLFFFLAPLHPEYLLKLDIEKFIWLGPGYLIPGGNPPFTMSFAWISIIGIIVFYKNNLKYNLYSSILLVVLISTLILIKIPMFIAFTVFLGVIALAMLAKKNPGLFLICFFSFVLSLVFYKYNYHEDGQKAVSFSFGYLPLLYAKLAGLKGIFAGSAVVLVMLLIYGGIRYAGLFFIWKYNNTGSNLNASIVIAMLISILVTVLVASIFKILILNPDGTVLRDDTFNLEQFVRAAFGLMSIIPIAGFVILFYRIKLNRFRKVALAICIGWCTLTFMSTIKLSSEFELINLDTKWYREVTREILTLRPRLAAVHSSQIYSGQQLAAADLCKFWVSTIGREGGYNFSNVNSWRWKVMDQCLSSDSSFQIQAYHTLLDNHVDAIIASPETIEQLKLFAKYNKIELPAGFKWTYPLKNHTKNEVIIKRIF